MIRDLRVGIPIVGSHGWLGGVSHMELHIKAVTSLPEQERPQLFLIITEESLGYYEFYRPFISLFNGVIFMGNDIQAVSVTTGLPLIQCKTWDEVFDKIDFFFPVSFNVLPNRCAASWVHDFQHKHLPDFFPAQDIAIRDELCQRIADQARMIFCSSRSVEKDFRQFYPDSRALTYVLALRIIPEANWYTGDPLAVQKKYNLPDKFVVCSNQFWIHKNHRLLFEAIAHLRQAGHDIHLVCTGLTSDFRCPGYTAELKEYIESLGIGDLVHILGQVPRQDQIQLIRRCLFVVQPSLFEGLSLIVQECRALGKTIVLSDLDVHLEHEYGIYFKKSDAQDLADKMGRLIVHAQPGPDVMHEIEAKLQAAGLTTGYAKAFCQMVEESQVIFSRTNTAPLHSPVLIATSLELKADMSSQKRAISSWLQAGFSVVSVNRPEDITALRPDFPDLSFIAVSHSPGDKYRTSRISIHDLLHTLSQRNTTVCGIVEPDICLYGHDLAASIAREAVNCLVYQEKTCIDTLQDFDGTAFPGLGCVFFDHQLIPYYPNDDFSLDQPWWDYWAILMITLRRIPVKHITTTPFAYHITHSESYNIETMIARGEILTKYAPPPFKLSAGTITKYQYILTQIINNHSLAVALYGLTVNDTTKNHDKG